jgi:hypothetical protein
MCLFRLIIMEIIIAIIRIISCILLCRQSMIDIKTTLTSNILINKIRGCLKISYLAIEPEAPASDRVLLLM